MFHQKPLNINININIQLSEQNFNNNDKLSIIETKVAFEEKDSIENKPKICFVHKLAFCNSIINIFVFNLIKYQWFSFFDFCKHIQKYYINDNIHFILSKMPNETHYRIHTIARWRNPETDQLFSKKNKLMTPFLHCLQLTVVIFWNNIKVRSIPKFCFSFTSLEEITIPSSVRYIKKYAFKDCKKLQKFTILYDSEMINISEGAFYGCKRLSLFNFRPNIKNISKKCFAFSGLESIYFPKFIKKVNSMAFFKCDKLRKINFNEGIVELGESSFQNNISLKSIDIPNSLTILKSY